MSRNFLSLDFPSIHSSHRFPALSVTDSRKRLAKLEQTKQPCNCKCTKVPTMQGVKQQPRGCGCVWGGLSSRYFCSPAESLNHAASRRLRLCKTWTSATTVASRLFNSVICTIFDFQALYIVYVSLQIYVVPPILSLIVNI